MMYELNKGYQKSTKSLDNLLEREQGYYIDSIIWTILISLSVSGVLLFFEFYAALFIPIITLVSWLVQDRYRYNRSIKDFILAKECIRTICDLNLFLENTKENLDSLDIIIDKIEKNHVSIREIRLPRKIRKNPLDHKIVSKKQLEAQVFFYLKILNDLKIDFITEIEKKVTELQSAKSETTSNISWTPELSKVSDLQKARLDRQIEQFEELQRVLVKV